MPTTRRMPAFSVRTRIVVVITLVAAAAMLSVGVSVYLVERAGNLQAVDDRLRANLASARFLVQEGDADTGDWESSTAALRAVVQRMSPDDNTGAVGIVKDRAALVPGVPLEIDLQRSDFITTVVAAAQGDDAVIGTFAPGDVTWRYLAVPLEVAGSAEPSRVVFAMAYDVEAELRELDGAARVFLITTAIAVAVIAVVATIVSTRLLRPLRDMRETAQRVSAQSLSERLPVHGRDDVSELAGTMNDMLDRLGDALDSQRRLLSDVGHELKTPITIVRGYVEVMDAADPGDVRETQRLVTDELDRMGGLVQDLAGAASLYGPQPVAMRPVDTADLVDQIARKAAAIEGAEVSTGSVADVATRLDPARITQAMLQLAQNAVTHGGGSVQIGCRAVGAVLELSVSDHGPGVPADARTAIFDRFHRGTDAEGRGTRGSGLGLDIVRLIAEAHGGRAFVRDADGGGAQFVIAIPLRVVGEASPTAHSTNEGPDSGIHPHR
ncbi:MAG: HAMP domain-containing sensor histidine kinase [Microbacterium sp.]|uniref:sensor histidine kinase n=1 Tax=Microbacterium sp. TaxID=51671 RepID=UPI0039E68F5E